MNSPRACNLRLTQPVPAISDRSAKLATRTVWLANHSTPTPTVGAFGQTPLQGVRPLRGRVKSPGLAAPPPPDLR
ncbi:MAG TPA: hypothetical protein IGS53_07000 [Leptolyngbyaceae cyanobacterium M33_DOE_097]|uniref:Uncharacterized protein n=1 Tax=Oscillatoriales cyanobacterium SpSt-418 TaxID=2282169 RepID=A0A7C3PHI7_9CYAN|nr:hypothetical protein [Leptolyngbyaceae cyanobacterium M33_DOE_097]